MLPGMTARTQRLLLLDTASLYFRAFFGVPMTTVAPDGTPVNAVRGLVDFISRLVGEYEPTHLVCCWDNDWRPQWRVDLIPSYKSHRVVAARPGPTPDIEEVPDPLQRQIPIMLDVLAALGICVVGADGYEADDVIGTLATDAGMPVDVVTGDRDLFQLVDDEAQVRILYIARGVAKHERVTNDVVREKYGIDATSTPTSRRCEATPRTGCPGVPGVGDKTAASLLRKFDTIEALLLAADDPESDLAPGPRARSRRPPTTSPSPRPLSPSPATSISARSMRDCPPRRQTRRALVELANRWGLDSPLARLVDTLRTVS